MLFLVQIIQEFVIFCKKVMKKQLTESDDLLYNELCDRGAGFISNRSDDVLYGSAPMKGDPAEAPCSSRGHDRWDNAEDALYCR